MTERATAYPAKQFFVSMITRDLSLTDCILDLVDNSVDGATRGVSPLETGALEGFWIEINLDPDAFSIADNCGGISIDDAKNYAFHFGRLETAPRRAGESIGVYGIGMKRAVFKLGGEIDIASSTSDESFTTHISVATWERETATDWGFDLETGEPLDVAGTVIRVTELNKHVGRQLSDPMFAIKLHKAIARGYSLFLHSGLVVKLNGTPVEPEHFELLVGGEVHPGKVSYEDDDVSVELVAGMAAPPQTDVSAEANIHRLETFGWYVICNDRVVLPADRTGSTVWGDDGFAKWHNQYNGFVGVASFRSGDPAMLPWTTTKRALDASHQVFRRAVVRMKKLTQPFIDYTNVLKDQEKRAQDVEAETTKVAIGKIDAGAQMSLPKIDPTPRIRMGNILFRKPKDRIHAAAEAMGNSNLSYKEVGSRAFEYFYEREVGD